MTRWPRSCPRSARKALESTCSFTPSFHPTDVANATVVGTEICPGKCWNGRLVRAEAPALADEKDLLWHCAHKPGPSVNQSKDASGRRIEAKVLHPPQLIVFSSPIFLHAPPVSLLSPPPLLFLLLQTLPPDYIRTACGGSASASGGSPRGNPRVKLSKPGARSSSR